MSYAPKRGNKRERERERERESVSVRLCWLGTWVARDQSLEELPPRVFNSAGVVADVQQEGEIIALFEMKLTALCTGRRRRVSEILRPVCVNNSIAL
jgi:hypothetical protein